MAEKYLIRKERFKMFKLEIKTENAAFTDDPRGEIARILEELVSKVRNGYDPSVLLDYNGNKVGKVTWDI